MGNAAEALRIVDMRCEGLAHPLGVPCQGLHVAWRIAGDARGVRQTAYAIQVVRDRPDFEQGPLDLEELVESDSSCAVPLRLPELAEKTVYYWRVKARVDTEDERGVWLAWSEAASFETGLADAGSWRGQWIEADEAFYADADQVCRQFWKEDAAGYAKNGKLGVRHQGLMRVPYLGKEFELKGRIVKGRLYITARGFYEARLNGKKIGPCALAPDFTAYDKCIYYQTFDITSELKEGRNRLDILLGDGWFAGHAQGIPGTNHLYGDRPALLMQADICYEDGTKETVASDDSFSAAVGPLQYADLFMGEYYDMRYEDQSLVYGTVVRDYDKSVVVPQRGELIVATEILNARRVFRDAEGSLIVDFGQAIAGRVRLRLTGGEGDIITIEHSEELDHNGVFHDGMSNFPFHDQKNVIRFASTKTIVYEPQFSFQGFRYIRVSGLSGELRPEDCQAVVIGTGMAVVGSFRCSNEDLNRLMSNILWSQRGNMLSIPTDCPQRERAGFTGDAQIFARAAALNMDVAGFFARWLEQCRYEQLERGQIPIVVPYTNAYREMEPNPGWTSAGWGDAIVFLPWDMYQAYGDIRFLRDNYAAMLRWMDYVETCAQETMPERAYFDFEHRRRHRYLWNTGHHWGDWQVPGMDHFEGALYTKEITASLYYYRAVRTMAMIARELGDDGRSAYYEELGGKIREAFHQEYITAQGRLVTEWQGAYVMAIAFGMVEGELKAVFAKRLNELVVEQDYHLQTGFLSTPFLLDALWDCGYRETALRLLWQETPPSWLYQVRMGATTVWEDWFGKDQDGVVKGTSFNHYAFGAVCTFIYERIGGVRRLDKGFRRVLVRPEATDGLDYAETSLRTIHGELYVKWVKERERLRLTLRIPHNTSAVVTAGDAWTELGSGAYELMLDRSSG
jgi:alpha-L-rhamnosidase